MRDYIFAKLDKEHSPREQKVTTYYGDPDDPADEDVVETVSVDPPGPLNVMRTVRIFEADKKLPKGNPMEVRQHVLAWCTARGVDYFNWSL